MMNEDEDYTVATPECLKSKFGKWHNPITEIPLPDCPVADDTLPIVPDEINWDQIKHLYEHYFTKIGPLEEELLPDSNTEEFNKISKNIDKITKIEKLLLYPPRK